MDSFCAIVGVYGYRANLPCIWLSPSMARYSGIKDINPPSIGSEVLVWLPSDGKYGIIMGAVNSPSDNTPRQQASLSDTDYNHKATDSTHEASKWGLEGTVMSAGAGTPTDTLPGDHSRMSEMGAGFNLLKFVAVMQGGKASKIEAFVIDELLRVTGFNYQLRTSGSEENVFCDYGRIDATEQATHLLSESVSKAPILKAGEKDPNAGKETGRWRWKRFRGALGNFVQKFVVRPHQGNEPDRTAGTLKEPEKSPDLGMGQDITDLSGHRVVRSVVGVGMHKSVAIAVPKKRFEADDPEGDRDEPETLPVEDFEFSSVPKCQASFVAQLRDYFAWMFNKRMPQRLLEKPKDWDVPDESNCPTPGNGSTYPPGVGGFYREFPQIVDAMASQASTGQFDDDTKVEGGKKITVGDAFIHITPDGCIVMKAQCGSQVTIGNGHIEFSASHDVRTIAGGSVVSLAGDDQVIKAKQSVDITSTENQVRVKGERDVFIHSNEGGLMFSISAFGGSFDPKAKGENLGVPGILIKTPSGGIQMTASQITMNPQNMLYIAGAAGGSLPQIRSRTSLISHWIDGSWITRSGGGYHILQGGRFFNSDGFQTDGNISARGQIGCGGGLYGSVDGEGHVGGLQDWSKVKSLSSITKSFFDASIWEELQWPLSKKDLDLIKFGFRKTEEYATTDGNWFQAFWQMDLGGSTSTWDEKPSDDQEYPYPGKDHYIGGLRRLWHYKETNLDPIGRYVPRDLMKKGGGVFTGKSWKDLQVLPRR